MWHWLEKLFGNAGSMPTDPPRLSAATKGTLSSSLLGLPCGERGWITLIDAARLFSTEEREYAFGEMDDEGKRRLGEFASECRCEVQFMPKEGHVYFRRTS
jgi:hypothetical protein